MNNLRPTLYVLLAMILFFIWTDWENRATPHPVPTVATQTIPNAPGSTPQAPTRIVPTAPHSAAIAAPNATLTLSGPSVHVHTDTMTATISTTGANIGDLVLHRYFRDKSRGQKFYPLLRPSGAKEFINQNGLLAYGPVPNQNSPYTTTRTDYRLKAGHQHLRVPFRWAQKGLVVVKTYTFTRDSYVIGVSYDIQNTSTKARHIYLYNQFLHGPPPETHFYHSEPIYIGASFYTPAQKYQKLPFPDMAKHPLEKTAQGGWVAISQHYFLGAAIPPAQTPAIFYSAALSGPRYMVGYKTATAVVVKPQAHATLKTLLFLGPKTPSVLKTVAPGLSLTVDYGWLTVLAQPLYWVLAHIEHVIGNWGVAIILLTVLIKLIFFPLSAASFKSMAKMRRLQPRMAALKERHGSDKSALQQAMIDLYKQEKMNPLGGCLPMIVQIPVFIALYWVLLDTVALRDAPFILWIHNLAAPDPYFVLPILMGASMVVQQLLNPAVVDPMQRKIMMFMPVIFTTFFLFFPAGLVLYWVVNNVLSILQQWWIIGRVEKGAS